MTIKMANRKIIRKVLRRRNITFYPRFVHFFLRIGQDPL